MQETIKNQSITITSLNETCTKLNTALQYKENDSVTFKSFLSELKTNIEKMKENSEEITVQKKELKSVNSKVKKLKEQLSSNTMPKDKQSIEYKTKITQLLQDQETCSQVLSQKLSEVKMLKENENTEKLQKEQLLAKSSDLKARIAECKQKIDTESNNIKRMIEIVSKNEVNRIAWAFKLKLMEEEVTNIREVYGFNIIIEVFPVL